MGRDIDDLPKNAANYTALTPLWFLERAAYVHPERASIVHGTIRYTWRQTYERCRRLASALSSRSIGPGSTVRLPARLLPAIRRCGDSSAGDAQPPSLPPHSDSLSSFHIEVTIGSNFV